MVCLPNRSISARSTLRASLISTAAAPPSQPVSKDLRLRKMTSSNVEGG